MEETPHRKRIVHYNVSGHAHLLTFSCYRRMALLTNDSWRSELSAAIDRAFKKHNWGLIAFVYMPEHVHILAHPKQEEYKVDAVLFAIKRPFSYRIKVALQQSDSSLLTQLTIQTRPGQTAFRFWQEGGGHDRNLISVENCVKAVEYIHNNPVRRGLCKSPELWRWSSWKFYHRPAEYERSVLPRVSGFPG